MLEYRLVRLQETLSLTLTIRTITGTVYIYAHEKNSFCRARGGLFYCNALMHFGDYSDNDQFAGVLFRLRSGFDRRDNVCFRVGRDAFV